MIEKSDLRRRMRSREANMERRPFGDVGVVRVALGGVRAVGRVVVDGRLRLVRRPRARVQLALHAGGAVRRPGAILPALLAGDLRRLVLRRVHRAPARRVLRLRLRAVGLELVQAKQVVVRGVAGSGACGPGICRDARDGRLRRGRVLLARALTLVWRCACVPGAADVLRLGLGGLNQKVGYVLLGARGVVGRASRWLLLIHCVPLCSLARCYWMEFSISRTKDLQPNSAKQ